MGAVLYRKLNMKVGIVLLCFVGIALASPTHKRHHQQKKHDSLVRRALDEHKIKREESGEDEEWGISPAWSFLVYNSSCLDAGMIEAEMAELEQGIMSGELDKPETLYDVASAIFAGILGTPAACFHEEGWEDVCTGLALGMKEFVKMHTRMDLAILEAGFEEYYNFDSEEWEDYFDSSEESEESEEKRVRFGRSVNGKRRKGPGGRGPGGPGGKGPGGPGGHGPPRNQSGSWEEDMGGFEFPNPCSAPPPGSKVLNWLTCHVNGSGLATLPHIKNLQNDLKCYLDAINEKLVPFAEENIEEFPWAVVLEVLQSDSIPLLEEGVSGLGEMLEGICKALDDNPEWGLSCKDVLPEEKKTLAMRRLKTLLAHHKKRAPFGILVGR